MHTNKIFKKITSWVLIVMIILTIWANIPINNVQAASQADAIVSVALAEEGYTEGANNNNKYGAALGQNNVAWCALFISWCARQAGIPTSTIKTNAWAGDMGSSKKTGNFGGQYYPKGSITPQKGDIVYYDWNKNGSSDHVEIVISTSGSTFTSIGGNTKGDNGSTEGVRRHSNYSFTSSYVVGFERPNYSVTPSTWYTQMTPVNIGDDVYATFIKNDGWVSIGNVDEKVKLNDKMDKGQDIWRFIRQDDGSYVIYSCVYHEPPLCLDGYDCVNAGLYEYYGGNCQRWFIYGRWSGEYVFRHAGTDKVLTVPNNSNVIGTELKLETYSNSKSQQMALWNVDPVSYGSTLSVSVGNSVIPTTFSWNEAPNATVYQIRIKSGTSGNLITYKDIWNVTDTKYSMVLPEGYYEVYLDCCNRFSGKQSNVIKFNVKKGTCTHSYGSWTTTKSATCTSDGSKKRTCSICGQSETQTISKTEHKYTSKVVAPTCTSKGYTLHTCSVCNDSYKDNETSATGHKFGDWTTAKSATCTADGSKTRKCTICGKTETAVISKIGHKYTTKIVSSTFTEQGYTLHTCSVCGDSYKDNYTEMKIKGDINNDSSVGISDVVFLQQYLVKSKNISSEQFLAADMNSDGQVNVFDMIFLKRRILKG